MDTIEILKNHKKKIEKKYKVKRIGILLRYEVYTSHKFFEDFLNDVGYQNEYAIYIIRIRNKVSVFLIFVLLCMVGCSL